VHEIVHNQRVVEDLRSRGAVFVETLNEVPENGVTVFSAHGVSDALIKNAESRGLDVINATCPLVTKVHLEVIRNAKEGREVVLIGHAGHPEVNGTLGHYDRSFGGEIYLVQDIEDVAKLQVKNVDQLTFVTQTTLSVDDTATIVRALKQRFPNIIEPRRDDICYATQNRQDAVHDLAEKTDLILVVGSPNSSNSNRLREIADQLGKPAYLIDTAEDMHQHWLKNVDVVGVTAGASAPEVLVQEVIEKLKQWGGKSTVENKGIEEKVVFSIPKSLKQHISA
jgi:4-hydroxy-3-methylbut-2-enyl diphosphate reductase